MAKTLKPSVIVVDDDPDMAALISLAAQSTGFNVRRADSAAAFINLFNENEPSAIVMDIVMPDKDGIELIEWLAIQKCVAPIILISGYDGKYLDMTSHVASAQGIVIAGTLTKPFELGGLEMLLKQVFDAFET